MTTASPKCLCFLLPCCEPRADVWLRSPKDTGNSKHCWDMLRWEAGVNLFPNLTVLCIFLLASPSYPHGSSQHYLPSSSSQHPLGVQISSRAFLVPIQRRDERLRAASPHPWLAARTPLQVTRSPQASCFKDHLIFNFFPNPSSLLDLPQSRIARLFHMQPTLPTAFHNPVFSFYRGKTRLFLLTRFYLLPRD